MKRHRTLIIMAAIILSFNILLAIWFDRAATLASTKRHSTPHNPSRCN